MNIEALIEAAKEIDRRAEQQERRAVEFQRLASEARKVEPNSREHQAIQTQVRLLSSTVVDFGDAVAALRRALRARPKRTSQT